MAAVAVVASVGGAEVWRVLPAAAGWALAVCGWLLLARAVLRALAARREPAPTVPAPEVGDDTLAMLAQHRERSWDEELERLISGEGDWRG